MAGAPENPPHPSLDVELVRRAQRGDAAAFAALHREFVRVVHGIALAHGPIEDVDDVTQEVFVMAFEHLPQLREVAAFGGWLCAAARNTAVDARRRRRRRDRWAAPSAALPAVAAAGVGPAAAAEQRDAAERVLACVRSLPEAYRETLVLRLCEGLGGREIAARTGLTHGSVRVNLTRGMALLRPLLEEAGLP